MGAELTPARWLRGAPRNLREVALKVPDASAAGIHRILRGIRDYLGTAVSAYDVVTVGNDVELQNHQA